MKTMNQAEFEMFAKMNTQAINPEHPWGVLVTVRGPYSITKTRLVATFATSSEATAYEAELERKLTTEYNNAFATTAWMLECCQPSSLVSNIAFQR